MTAATEWNWLDGDIGRRKTITIDDKKAIVELSPMYMGRGAYTNEWYMHIFLWDNFYSSEFDGSDDILATATPIEFKYVTDENGDEIPDAVDLDSKANHILANLKQCATCGNYYYYSNWDGEPSFCDINHHNMWEAAQLN